MHKLTLRSAFAAIAVAAVTLGSAAVASAGPIGPCEEVTYVGVCDRVGETPQRSPSQQGMGEVFVPGISSEPVLVG